MPNEVEIDHIAFIVQTAHIQPISANTTPLNRMIVDRTGLCWENFLAPYYPVNTRNAALQCPAYIGGIPDLVNGHNSQNSGSYGYNAWGATEGPVNAPGLGFYLGLGLSTGANGIFLDDITPIITSPRRDSQIVAPSELFAFMDSWGLVNDQKPPQWNGSDWTRAPVVGGMTPETGKESGGGLQNPPQHGTHFNVVSCDGHVESIRITNLFYQQGIAPTPVFTTSPRWNIDHQAHQKFWNTFPP